MMNYGSYLSDKVNVGTSTAWIVVLAVMSSILGGLMIMPAVFAFGLTPDAGPGLTFATMPAVFSHLPMGGLFAVAFYGCLFVAALTSAISILEMVSQHCVDRWGFSRRTAVLTVSTVLGRSQSLQDPCGVRSPHSHPHCRRQRRRTLLT